MAILFLLLLLLAPPPSYAAISCSDVIKDIRPCVNYLKNGSGMPPAACCTGASNLASSATTTADKQAACNCIKSAAKNANIKSELAKALPANCGITLSIPISPNTDCTKIT
ncbi:unnamed protein product [Ilex paraguariensis]|uniref:Non-specific lipid-transfer protein n=1 Tax=Ilex paraguariensis TaxID=185542 RepID=A0ABC8RMK5_9AQUA